MDPLPTLPASGQPDDEDDQGVSEVEDEEGGGVEDV